jgi:quinol monooxygenase YgiN
VIVVSGTIDFADGPARDAAVLATAELQRATRDDEPGCLAYCFAADPVEPARVQIYELWRDEASLAAHFRHANYGGMRQVLRSYPRTGQSVTSKLRCDLIEPVYGADGVPRATFDG